MRKTNALLFLLAFVLLCALMSSTASAMEYTWTEAQPPDTGVGGATLACANGHLYLIGGNAYSSPPSNEPFVDIIQRYDPATDLWQLQTATTPYALSQHNDAATVGSKIIMGPHLGATSNNGWGTHRRVIEFDTVAQTCVETADYGYVNWTTCVVDGGNGYAYSFGGWTGGGVDKIFRYHYATQTLELLPAKLSVARGSITGLRYGDKIYLFGGNRVGKTVEVFDIATETIQALGQILPDDLVHNPGYQIYLVHAWDSGMPNVLYVASDTNGHVYEFDTQTNAFTRTSWDLPGFNWGEDHKVMSDPATRTVYVVSAFTKPDNWRETRIWVGKGEPPKLYGLFVATTDARDDAPAIHAAFSRFDQWAEDNPEPLILDDSIESSANKQAVSDALDDIKSRLDPGDNFVFYYAGHGGFPSSSGDETPITIGTWPFWLVENTQDEYLTLSKGWSNKLSDDTLRSWLDDPVWDGVHKLVLLDACHSGGFWGDNNPNDTGDLEKLPRVALWAACPEEGLSYGIRFTHRGFWSVRLELELNAYTSLSDIAAALADWDWTELVGKNLPLRATDDSFPPLGTWKVFHSGDWQPVFYQTSDFAMTLTRKQGSDVFPLELDYIGDLFHKFAPARLVVRATENESPKSGVHLTFAGTTLWSTTQTASAAASNAVGLARVNANWTPDVYEFVAVDPVSGMSSSPVALTIYSNNINGTSAGGAIYLGGTRRRATFGLRDGTSDALLFLDPDNPSGRVRISCKRFRSVLTPAPGVKQINGYCELLMGGANPVNRYFEATVSATQFDIRVMTSSMRKVYEASGNVSQGGLVINP